MSNFNRENNNFGLSRRGFVKSLFGTALVGLPLYKDKKSPSLKKELRRYEGSAYDEDFWMMVRKQFDLTDDYIFMNNGTKGPSPRVTVDKMEKAIVEIATNPGNYSYLYGELVDNKKIMAEHIGCTPEELAMTHCTTEGMNISISGLDLKAGDEILTTDHEHPGGTGPMRLKAIKTGAVIKSTKTGSPPKNKGEILNRINDAVTRKTKVICVSHICFTNALVLPVKEICTLAREKGIISVIDGAHPYGMLALDMHDMNCDFYAAAGQKWMMGPLGTGILYARQESQDLCMPTIVSGSRWEKDKTAGKYESGSTRCLAGQLGFGEAVKFQVAIGKVRIEERLMALSNYFREKAAGIPGIKLFSSLDPSLSAALTAITVKDYPADKILAKLKEKFNIWPRTVRAHDLSGLRFSFHIYNNFKEVDLALEALAYVSKNGV